ncbi:MAG: DEAD/DEAH box helicase [Acidimicrobiales bacterium]
MSEPHQLTSLYHWQLDALVSWLRCGRRGVVEAVTGSGKTDLALAAIGDALRRDRFVLVVVPSRVLMEQWHTRLTRAFPAARIGRLGDSYRDRVENSDVLVTTRHSAATYRPVPPDEGDGMLIADECHGFGGGVLRKSLLKAYDERLGLTATLERSDNAVETVLLPYFGGVCYRYGFREAIADGVCAQPRVAFLAVPLSREEREEYIATENTLVSARQVLKAIPGMPREPFGDFLAAVAHLADNDGGPNGRAASEYLDAFSKRRDIVASSSAKYESLGAFENTIRHSDGTLLFTETVRAANHAINRLDPVVGIEIITGDTGRTDRERILGSLRDGELDAVAAPRVLDEGIDVPDANLGIVVSASRTRRQMIQRMGRILRRKQPGRGARFVIIFARDTLEDPTASVERDGFMDEIESIAESAMVFERSQFDALDDYMRYAGPDEVVDPTFVGPFGSDTNADEVLGDLDRVERYATLSYVPWAEVTEHHHQAWAEPMPVPEEPAYVEIEKPFLPEVERQKVRTPKKLLSTGENPVRLVNQGQTYVLQCTGCGVASAPTQFRWEALEATVECTCDD